MVSGGDKGLWSVRQVRGEGAVVCWGRGCFTEGGQGALLWGISPWIPTWPRADRADPSHPSSSTLPFSWRWGQVRQLPTYWEQPAGGRGHPLPWILLVGRASHCLGIQGPLP